MRNDIPVTSTKIILPRKRTDLLSRARLLDLMYELMDNKLIIVAAPAGYGKTSLLLDFAYRIEIPVCWYALDTLDVDPQRFLTHFIASINLRFPKFGNSSFSALKNTNQEKLDLDYLVSVIVNDVYENIGEHFVIVLDDYHLVDTNDAIGYFVNRFIQDCDENCHLIITSRVLLSLPNLSLMVARSQVGGLSFEELGFRPEEIKKLFLQNYNRTISDQTANELAEQTEGWITGLLLSTQTNNRQANDLVRIARTSGVGLYEYLAQQVLEQQSEALREFLLRTSLLEEFNADLCEQVIQPALGGPKTNWRHLMEKVMRHNLFVLPVGENGSWLRYHHLFRDFLRAHMVQERPDETRCIQLTLAAVYSKNGEWEKSFNLYQQLGQTDELVQLAESVGTTLLSQGRLATLTRWLTELPAEAIDSRPALLSLRGGLAIMRSDIRQAIEYLDQAIQQVESAPPSPATKMIQARSYVRRASAYRIMDDHTRSLADAEVAFRLSKGDPDLCTVLAEAMRSIGMSYFQTGKISESLDWLAQSLAEYQSQDEGENIAVLQLEIGIVQVAAGKYTAAEEMYQKAYEYWRTSGNAAWQANLLNNLGVLKHTLGDYEAAATTLEKALYFARSSGYTRLEAFALSSLGDIYRDLEAGDEALGAYNQAHALAEQINDRFLLFYLNLIEASQYRLQGKLEPAIEKFETARGMLQNNQATYESSLYDLETSALHMDQGDFEQARQHLSRASAFFKKEGYLVEASRAYLYWGLTSFHAGQKDEAVDQIKTAMSFIPPEENSQPLIVSAKNARDYIDPLMGGAPTKPLLTSLVRKIDRFEKHIPILRRQLRQHATSVPFAPPKMLIRALGRMQVKLNGHLITSSLWQTKAARDLFFLLVSHPEGLTKESVGSIFWPDASPAELKIRFKNLIYRLRHALGKEAVTFQEEYYRFNRSLDYDYDVENFYKNISLAGKASQPSEQIHFYRTALKYYRGMYLPGIEESWVLAERERIYQAYLDTLLKLAEIHMDLKQFDAALDYCRRTLAEDPCFEAAHRLAMRVQSAQGNRAAVARQYERCKQALMQEINAPPSVQTQDLFNTLMH
ncbi:MAG: tetratricopeptide repeat protein [Chloroflexi bacterium]|nr:tetratricopeptide repeat protein [Anaerolineaceae bacterium]NMB89907.1 tetratricopeptide repeat protein [Chloroflexota bacterium]